MDTASADRRLRRDTAVRAVMAASKNRAWLVGGYIRDLLMRGKLPLHPRDYDFAVSCRPETLAMDIREKMGGTIVPLRHEKITRLALPQGDNIDISRLSGSLEEDLRSRDFTINAISWCPGEGFFDPLSGINDIACGVVRHVSKNNLKNDPLRLLRAYRMMAVTGFRINRETREAVRSLREHCAKPARERITHELIKIILSEALVPALQSSVKDDILTRLLAMRRDALKENIKSIDMICRRMGWVSSRWLRQEAGQGMDNRAAILLSALLVGSDHRRLSLSKAFISRHMRTVSLLDDARGLKRQDRAGIYDFLINARTSSNDLAIMSGKRWLITEDSLLRYQKKHPLVSASDIEVKEGIGPGPALGRRLMLIEKDRFIRKRH